MGKIFHFFKKINCFLTFYPYKPFSQNVNQIFLGETKDV